MTGPNDSVAARVRIALPLAASIVFLVLGFAFHAWRWAWIVYLVVPLGYLLLPRPYGRTRPERVQRRARRRSGGW